MTDPIFEPGDQVVCTNSDGYAFTVGKAYTVLKYEPRWNDGGNPFTWPAYVSVEDDNGKRAYCHAHRFKHVAEGAADE